MIHNTEPLVKFVWMKKTPWNYDITITFFCTQLPYHCIENIIYGVKWLHLERHRFLRVVRCGFLLLVLIESVLYSYDPLLSLEPGELDWSFWDLLSSTMSKKKSTIKENIMRGHDEKIYGKYHAKSAIHAMQILWVCMYQQIKFLQLRRICLAKKS